MEQTDYASIVLTKEEQQAFNKFTTTDIAELEESEFNRLRKKKLVEGEITPDSGLFTVYPRDKKCKITDYGKNLRIYQYNQRQIEQKADKRYAINTAISLAALVVSIISLIMSILSFCYR